MAYSINTGDKGGGTVVADVNLPITGAINTGVTVKDRLLAYDRWGVKKLAVATSGALVLNNIRIIAPGYVIEFPDIGGSLPCVFTLNAKAENTIYSISVVEYGGQPDPDYFNITGVDEEGNPVYAEEA